MSAKHFGKDVDFDDVEETDEVETVGQMGLELDPLMAMLPGEAERVAKKWIDLFFADKEMYCGGPIPRSILHDPSWVKLVLDLKITNGVDKAYDLMEKSGRFADEVDDGTNVTTPMRLVIDIFGMCHRAKVPQVLCAGITLMYLELCLGITMPKHVARRGFSKE